jgi:hypothetical protein
VEGYSLSTIHSKAKDIAAYHGKVVLFAGDYGGNCECILVILPPQSAFKWKKCLTVDDKSKLRAWYVYNPSQYGMLWDPTAADGAKVELKVPHMIAAPHQVAQLYHHFKGTVMLQELLEALKMHLGGPNRSLGNGDNWGLVQKWLPWPHKWMGGMVT